MIFACQAAIRNPQSHDARLCATPHYRFLLATSRPALEAGGAGTQPRCRRPAADLADSWRCLCGLGGAGSGGPLAAALVSRPSGTDGRTAGAVRLDVAVLVARAGGSAVVAWRRGRPR